MRGNSTFYSKKGRKKTPQFFCPITFLKMKIIDILQYGFPDAKLYSCKYPKAEELNPSLHQLIINITKDSEHPNNMGALMSEPYDFRIKEFNIIAEYTKEVLGNLKDAPYPHKYNPLKLVELWGQYYKKGAYQISHYHAHSDWSFVYYVNTPDESSPLVFDKSNKEVYSKAGEVVIFPGWLVHHVPENKGEGRSVISGNLSYDVC